MNNKCTIFFTNGQSITLEYAECEYNSQPTENYISYYDEEGKDILDVNLNNVNYIKREIN